MTASSALALDGRVVEEGTGKPLAAVVVSIQWFGSKSVIVDPGSSCYAAELLVTSDDGAYRIPSWSGSINPFIVGRQRAVNFYKPGYRTVARSDDEALVTMARRDPADRERNFKEVERQLGGYACDLSAEKKLKLLKPVYEELSQWAQTPAQRDTLRGVKYSIDLLEHGQEVAERNERAQRMRDEGEPRRPPGQTAPAPAQGSLGVRKQ